MQLAVAAGWPPFGKRRLARLTALVVLSLSCCLCCLCVLLPLLVAESSFPATAIDSLAAAAAAAAANRSSQLENPIKANPNDNPELAGQPEKRPPRWLLFESSGASSLLQDEQVTDDDDAEEQQQQQPLPLPLQEAQSFKRPSLPSNPSQQQRENSQNPQDENSNANQATNKRVPQPPPPLSRNRRLALDRMRYVLMCQVLDGDLPIQIKWFKDGQELDSMALQQQQQPALQRDESSLQIEMLSNDELGSSLLFRRVQQKHSGNYTCLASNHLGSSSFSSSLSVKTRSSGGQELASVAAAAPAPASQTQTFKLINSNHHVQTLENGSLAIRQTSKEDEGLYLCEADNGLEPSLVKVVRLIVHLQAQIVDEIQLLGASQPPPPPPSIEVGPPSSLGAQISTASAGATGSGTGGASGSISAVIRSVRLANTSSSSSVRLLCRPLGELPLTVDWLKDEQPVHTQTITTGSGSAATFVAEPAGSQYGSQPAADEQLTGGGGGGGGGGSRLHVSTRPSPQAAGRTAAAAPMQPQLLLLPLFESELQLTGLRRSDAGLFTCVARNAFGRSERRLKLVLQEAPEPPEVVDVAHIGSRTVGLRWLMPQFDGHSPILKFVVEFAKLGPSLQPQPQPQPQRGPELAPTNQLSANSAAAADQFAAGSWTNQVDSSLLAGEAGPTLLIGHSERPMPQLQQQAKQADQQQQPVQHTVHELEPLTRYSMRVIAVNAVGRSRPSAALTLRTEEEVPSVVPSSVGATVLGSRSVKLHWTLAYSPEREIIDGFFIGYRSFDAAAGSLLDGGGKLSAATTSAAAAAADSNSAQAAPPALPAAAAGQQLEQPTFTYKTVRLNRAPDQRQSHQPHQPQLQQSAEQLDSHSAYLSPVSSITKALASANNNNGNTHIQQTPNNINNNNNNLQQLVSSFEFVIGGLERNTEYSILIQCFNRKGAGPTSDPVIFKTFANDPPEKLALNVDEISESSVRVHWRFIHSNEKYQLVDGFVLAFAKLINNRHSGPQLAGPAADLTPTPIGLAAAADRQQAARIAQPAPRGFANFSGQTIDQWQAIQLSPQQRSHQLKNLECGTSYAMKIWAFNKIGKGEPSELVTVSTRGKAPIAPDRRSFLSVNSTQVRLHLSAWYDGGCEIDKFIVQYRAWGGQHDWILVSDNILREQLSVVIRDLSPATSYELSVGAQSQVGLTEVKYRFITLDREGKPVSPPANLFASSASDDSADYPTAAEADGTSRRDFWPPGESGASVARSLLVLRHFLNSPLALVLSLCFFVVLLMVLIFYRFNADSQPLSSSSSSSNRSARSISTLNLNSSNKLSGGRTSSSGEPNTTIMNDCELIGGGGGGGGGSGGSGCTDSPARLSTYHQPSIRLINNSDNNNYSLAPSEPACHYQSFCGAAQPTMMRQADLSEYSHYGLPSAATLASNYEPPATAYGYAGLAAGQRSATMDQLNQQQLQQQQQQQPAGSSIQLVQVDHPDRNRQLMQMFTLGQNQQHLDPIPEMTNGLHHQKMQQANSGGGSSYVTAALATMARGTRHASGAMKPIGDQHHQHQHLFQAGTLGRQLHSTSSSNNNNNCGDIGFLGKPMVVHSACDGAGAGQSSTLQPHLSCQQTTTTIDSIDNNWATNNHRISMTTTDEQTSRPVVVGMAAAAADDRQPELYPLTTFRHPASAGIQTPTPNTFDVSYVTAIGAGQQQPAPPPPPELGSEQYHSEGSAASSSSGRGTATSASQDGPNNFKRPTMVAPTEACGSSRTIECPNVAGGEPSSLMEQSNICDEGSSNCSPYDVPFKFIKQQDSSNTDETAGIELGMAQLAKTICY